jgi:basic membrane protein A and related proteins
MKTKSIWKLLVLVLVVMLAMAACQPAAPAAEEPADSGEAAPADDEPADTGAGGLQIPEIVEGKFNVAAVMLSTHDDGGWSQAQYDGLLYLEENMDDVHTAYMETVAEGADSEQVFRALSRKGFDLIIGGSFGYMDPMEMVAAEFPDVTYIHISGYKSNMENFGNLFGAMEDMKYAAGMIAGARAKMDGANKVGLIATFEIPEEFRLANGFALGVRRTCPECEVDLRWIHTWHDPIVEREAADSLFDSGSHVVITGADTPAPALAAAEREGVWAMTYDWSGSCTHDECLTAPYWVWGPEFQRIAEGVRDGTYQAGWDYYDAETGGLGLYGFMPGEELQPGVAELPEEDLAEITSVVEAMLAGEFTRFDVFSGPIMDNKGNVVVPEGEQIEQADIDQFPPGAPGLECTYCMYWFAEGITAELPDL